MIYGARNAICGILALIKGHLNLSSLFIYRHCN